MKVIGIYSGKGGVGKSTVASMVALALAKKRDEQAYNCRNMLAGFLQCCERFSHMTHEETSILFKELAK